jgi:hypothetical protein
MQRTRWRGPLIWVVSHQQTMGPTGDDDWEEVWDARADALAQVFGRGHDRVFHAPHPFALGGQADVIAFHQQQKAVVYVTAELTGKPDACYADYELMICHRSPQDWGPNIISRLATYTQEAYIGAGESMDIDSATPPASRIKAFLFDTFATFTLFGHENAVDSASELRRRSYSSRWSMGPRSCWRY